MRCMYNAESYVFCKPIIVVIALWEDGLGWCGIDCRYKCKGGSKNYLVDMYECDRTFTGRDGRSINPNHQVMA